MVDQVWPGPYQRLDGRGCWENTLHLKRVSNWCSFSFELGLKYIWVKITHLHFELTVSIRKPTLVLCTFYLVHSWRKHNDCQLHQKQFDCLHLILGMWWLEHFEHLWHCFLWFNRFKRKLSRFYNNFRPKKSESNQKSVDQFLKNAIGTKPYNFIILKRISFQ